MFYFVQKNDSNDKGTKKPPTIKTHDDLFGNYYREVLVFKEESEKCS